MLNITGCDFDSAKPKALQKPPFAQARENARPALAEDGLTVNPIAALHDQTAPGEPMGLKPNRLFNNTLNNNEERFTRLENAVQNLADTVSKMAPSINRLVGIDQEMETLMAQLEVLINNKAVPPAIARSGTLGRPPAQNPVAASTMNNAPTSIIPSPAQTLKTVANSAITPSSAPESMPPYAPPTGRPLIHDLRVGDHGGKTRIVIESIEELAFGITLDKTEKLLKISFDEAYWEKDPSSLAKKSTLFSAVAQQRTGEGTDLVFALNKDTEKIGDGRIKPNTDNSYHRIYIDLSR